MVETTTNNPQNEAKMERFEFVLTINDYIVCQRYFRINGYRQESAYSFEIADAVAACVEIIDEDLKRKSNIWSHNTAPQVFKDFEEAEKWLNNGHKLKMATFVIIGENVYSYNGSNNVNEAFDAFEKRFNVGDYVKNENGETEKNTLKFAIYDNDPRTGVRKLLCVKAWDANVYPRFVRTNIDLSNQKNKYKSPDNFSMFEATMVDAMNNGGKDLIPNIVHTICDYLSEDSDYKYATKEKYGNTTYNFNVAEEHNKYIRSMEREYKNKTERYKKDFY